MFHLKEILELLREINERLKRIEEAQDSVIRASKHGKKYIATGQHNS